MGRRAAFNLEHHTIKVLEVLKGKHIQEISVSTTSICILLVPLKDGPGKPHMFILLAKWLAKQGLTTHMGWGGVGWVF